jgi:hypothetical protein
MKGSSTMALKVYKLQPAHAGKAKVVPTVNMEDQPDRGILFGMMLMVPFYSIIMMVIMLLRR